MDISLLIIQRRHPDPTGEGPRCPSWLPALGFIACVSFLVFHAVHVLG